MSEPPWKLIDPNTSTPPHAIPCPNCGQLVSVDAERCLNCNFPTPGIVLKFPSFYNLIRERVSFVNSLILICIVLYALAMALDPAALLDFSGGFSLFNAFSPSGEALYNLGMGGWVPLLQGRWWTLITAAFLHAGILHIGFNMLWLRQIGPLVEHLFGPSRFILIYLIAALTGSLLSSLLGTSFFVGASGAIFGLFGALLVYGWRRGGTFGSAVMRQSIYWAGIGFIFGFAVSGVDNWGHLGGFIGGSLAALLLGYQEKNRTRFWQHLAAVGILALSALCFLLMFIAFFTR